MSQQSDVKTMQLFLFGFFGAVLVVVLVFAMMVLYYNTESRLERERIIDQPYVDLDNALAAQQTKLASYGKLGILEEHGTKKAVYQIPIERAMELVLAEWKSGVLPGPQVEAKPADGPKGQRPASKGAAVGAKPAAAAPAAKEGGK